MSKKIGDNKALKIIGNILYYMLVVLVLLILLVVLLQRVTHNNASIGGIRIFNIVTESMVPEYQVGDILISKSIDPSKIEIGDDVVYMGEVGSFQGKIITHRVIDIEKDGDNYKFHTKGIANEYEDPAVVSEDQIYGTIIYKTHILSFISKIINNLYGFYFLIFIPLAVLIIVKIVKIHREKYEEDDDDEDEKNVKDTDDNSENKGKEEENGEEDRK
ncbi:MAG: signal peptidase I [Clostridia bacterium]